MRGDVQVMRGTGVQPGKVGDHALQSSVSASVDAPDTKYPRYTIGITRRQEQAILAECKRRGDLGFSEMIRRILDGWVERKIQQEANER